MIEFVTLLTLLLGGDQPIELRASPAVRVVELRLDGELVARREDGPWTFEVELGTLQPHLLEAVAFDAAGEELDRTTGLINAAFLPLQLATRFPAGDGWPPRRVRLLATGLPGDRAPTVRAWWNGSRAKVGPGGLVEVPSWDGSGTLDLEARARSYGTPAVAAGLTLGGHRPAEERSTAINLFVPPSGAEEMDGWLDGPNGTLTVLPSPREVPVLAVVLDRNLRGPLPPVRIPKGDGGVDRRRSSLELWAVYPGTRGRDVLLRGLDRSVRFPALPKALDRRVCAFDCPAKGETEQTLFEAVAHAGAAVARSRRPRAVLFLLDPSSLDSSFFDLSEVAEYLRLLQVPLFVWTPAAVSDSEDFEDGAVDADLQSLLENVVSSLRAQRIAVVEGWQLPSSVRLGERAPKEVRLVGADP